METQTQHVPTVSNSAPAEHKLNNWLRAEGYPLHTKLEQDDGFYACGCEQPFLGRILYYSADHNATEGKKRLQDVYYRLTAKGVEVTPKCNASGYWFLFVDTYDFASKVYGD